MAIYRVDIQSGDHFEITVDHADTVEMGGGYYTDEGSRELAQSYARVGIAQALRDGYQQARALITSSTGYREIILS